MIASRRSAARIAAALLLAASACRSPATVTEDDLLMALPSPAPIAPSDLDMAAARLAEASLATDLAALERAYERVEAAAESEREWRRRLGGQLAEAGAPAGPPAVAQKRRTPKQTTGVRIEPLARDVVNATLADPRDYRRASEELIEEGGLDPILRERLERAVADDPMHLARERDRDHLERNFAYHFNTVAETFGNTILTGVFIAPYRIAMAGLQWALGLLEAKPMSVQERQALVHRKHFLALHPDAPEADEVRQEVTEDEAELAEMRRDEALDSANDALADGHPRRAWLAGERALAAMPGDPAALGVRSLARSRWDEEHRLRARSLTAARHLADAALEPAELRALLEELWLDLDAAAPRARALAERTPELDDELELVIALWQLERGYEDAAWRRLRRLGRRDPEHSNVGRTASHWYADADQNPYARFRAARSHARETQVKRFFLGRFADGPRYKALPEPIAYLVDAPAIAQTLVLTPVRAVLSLGKPSSELDGPAARAARRYLAHYPDGQHARELIDWLSDYEQDQENWTQALRLADFDSDITPEQRLKLLEEAAEQQLSALEYLSRRDQRGSLLREVAREFPDTQAGHQAGMRAREEVETLALQHIRMTREFLRENPDVSGLRGLGLRRELLDGEHFNGELHPEGVSFSGGRELVFALLAESGKEGEPPVLVRRQVSPERLARAVALVDEATLRNARVDPDDVREPDAERDLFFERARLGLADDPDPRPGADSHYVFLGVRERYGMVRGRESILPFDLVVRGSLEDMSLGAFPRWRAPKETPDAFLYR